ncbi:MarR family winged helix-turn-helix transcriptional regulator [Nocardia blacklockiae]|uniref:MarR family winged helix-turn-helix transcriptional regulator n=1 Tax=Nocardia blacklockiae TaxID=480036 RepID=UPI0018959D34|nr:MarR family winged helix-turn-helix transcriptional regulator [Nocardia blacklockiae]MBF6171834.1 winged helix-turn-helix transcriptional regulator [Nocardia blacklockiae]
MSTDNGRPGPPAASASILVLTLAKRVESELGAALAPLDLTVGRLGLLGHIAGVPGASFSELARMSGISVQSAHTAVKALVGAGLVRDRTARAGSASTLELTAAGTRLLRAAEQIVTEVDERLFGAQADPLHRRLGGALVSALLEKPS